jgi:CMP-N,N'-diacetyllegionaminic acid synthase
MSNKTKFLAIIPARGGSKGIKNKNLFLINQKPLIFYTVKAALSSKHLSTIVLSTESKKIATYVKKFPKIKIPFLRPKKLSGDRVLTLPVLKYTLLRFEKLTNIKYDFIVLLQPTSPLRTAKDIDDSINLLKKKKTDSLISVTSVGANHPLRMKKILKNNRLINFVKQKSYDNMKPRQSLPKVYIRNGAIYIISRKLLMMNKISSKRTVAYEMSQNRSLNIDDYKDIILLKHIFNK